MAGEAKRDYPASIGYQSPWYREYKLIEDHFARVNAVMSRGRPVVRIAVIHPIESFWLCFGPVSQTSVEREEREQAFSDLTHWLLFGLLDFDFVCESLLPEQAASEVGFGVGDMVYDAVVVPGLSTIRSTTLDRLEAFADRGGAVIFAGEIPGLVDAEPSSRAADLAARCQRVPFSRSRILEALEPFREVDARLEDGTRATSLLYQLRQEGDIRYLFIVNTDRKRKVSAGLRWKDQWFITRLDTFKGASAPERYASYEHGTELWHQFQPHESILFELRPGAVIYDLLAPEWIWYVESLLMDPVPISLSEPNCLLLDQARYRIDGGEWKGPEEILRIENILRKHAGLAKNDGGIAQPWADTDPTPVLATLELKFDIEAIVEVDYPLLAIEDAGTTKVEWNGARVDTSDPTGYFVDECIQTFALPSIAPGKHELTLTIPFHRKRAIEWCYILGDFGVEVRGRHARIVEAPRTLAFGDWTTQGLPFYAGNVTYHFIVESSGGRAKVRAPLFKAPLLTCDVDGKRVGPIAFAPFELELGVLSEGEHRLDITAYGNRVNAFGPLHNVNPFLRWYGPSAWRSEGDDWAYKYQLKQMGVLTAPTFSREQLRGKQHDKR